MTTSSYEVQAQVNESFAEPFGFKIPANKEINDVNVDPFRYRGEPIEAGSFRLWPNITAQQEYNDNVYATENSTQSDLISVIKPSIIIEKQHRRHKFVATANAEFRQHWDLTDENTENYQLKLESDLEAKHGINIPISASYNSGHIKRNTQTRRDINDLTIAPLAVQNFEAETGIVYKPNRLSLSLLGNYRVADFDNGRLRNGTIVNRDNRDVQVTKGIIRASYDVSTGWTPYIEAQFSKDSFVNEAATSISRNNTLFRILTGTSFNYKGIVYGFFGLGLDNRSYDESQVADASALALESKISWEPSAKSKFTFDLSRETKEDNIIIAGLTQTASGLEYRHELKRDLFLKLMGSYNTEDFNDSPREDKIIQTGVEMNYIINPRFQLGAEYNYLTRDSTIKGLDLENNILMLRAKTAW